MNIKDNIGKIILWGNMAMVVIFYFTPIHAQGDGWFPLIFTASHIALNVVFAFFLFIAHLASKYAYPTLGMAMEAFLTSASLVLVISFPVCIWVDK